MTRAYVWAALCGVLFASFASGCAVDPKGTCESVCEEQRRRMCNGFTGDENCVANCSDAEANYDSAKADAERIGCNSQFDNVYGCASGGDYCDNSRCNAETNALVSCITSYCTVNPTDRVCASP
ncbi:MAG: hypothetical protein H6719_35295 [Sandaracinaceae bacterium]|nr:hypothetical protein [Sandaracinaceae bacterium]